MADQSESFNVVQYAVQTMMKKGVGPAAAAKSTAKKLSGYENFFLGPGITTIDAKRLEAALYLNLVNAVIAALPRIKPGMSDFALLGVMQHFNQKSQKVVDEVRELTVLKLGDDPFTRDEKAGRSFKI